MLIIPVIGSCLVRTLFVPFAMPAVRSGLDAAFASEIFTPPDYLDAYASYELLPPRLLAHAWDQALGQQATQKMISRYGEINVLLVLIYGTADRNVPNEQVQRFHLSAPKTILIEVSGAGHELMFAQPDTVLGGIAKLRYENKLSKQD